MNRYDCKYNTINRFNLFIVVLVSKKVINIKVKVKWLVAPGECPSFSVMM
jgi:hypothetical protein